MNPFVELNLALILFLPWFAILGVLYWMFPRQPRTASRKLFDGVALLLAFTDDRVRYERAPFDHPEIILPVGDASPGVDATRRLAAVGAAGGTALNPFLGLNPFQINP